MLGVQEFFTKWFLKQMYVVNKTLKFTHWVEFMWFLTW